MIANPSRDVAPDVSVIIPTWKAERFVDAAIASSLASRDVSLEVIAVDDASPDRTFDLLQTLAARDSRLQVDRLESNGGPSAARNRAIDLARGRYVAVLDADDTMEPMRLARLVALADRGAADIVVDNLLEVDAAGAPLGPGPFLRIDAFLRQRDITLLDWAQNNRTMTEGVCIGYLKPLFRRETLDRLRLRYDPTLRNSEDYYIVAHLLARGASMIYTPEALYRYTRSSSSTSSRLLPRDTAAWIDAEARFMAEHGAGLNPAESEEFRRRATILRNVHTWARAHDALKSRRFASFALTLAEHPVSSAFVLSQYARAGLGKLSNAVGMGRGGGRIRSEAQRQTTGQA